MEKGAWGCVTCLRQFSRPRPGPDLLTSLLCLPLPAPGLHPHYYHCYLGGDALSGRVGSPRGVGQTCVQWVSSELTGPPAPLPAWPVFPLRRFSV